MPSTIQQPLVGQRLRELRKQARLTRAELSTATGVSTSSIVRLESGNDVRLSTYLPILHYFVGRTPEVWVLAEGVAVLPAADRGRVFALLGDLGTGEDEHG